MPQPVLTFCVCARSSPSGISCLQLSCSRCGECSVVHSTLSWDWRLIELLGCRASRYPNRTTDEEKRILLTEKFGEEKVRQECSSLISLLVHVWVNCIAGRSNECLNYPFLSLARCGWRRRTRKTCNSFSTKWRLAIRYFWTSSFITQVCTLHILWLHLRCLLSYFNQGINDQLESVLQRGKRSEVQTWAAEKANPSSVPIIRSQGDVGMVETPPLPKRKPESTRVEAT